MITHALLPLTLCYHRPPPARARVEVEARRTGGIERGTGGWIGFGDWDYRIIELSNYRMGYEEKRQRVVLVLRVVRCSTETTHTCNQHASSYE